MAKNNYKHKRGSIIKFLLNLLLGSFAIVCILLVFLAMGEVLIRGYRIVTTTKYFRLKHVEVNGIQYLNKDYIKEIIDINKDQNIFNINLIELKNKLLQNNWVQYVSIKRVLPNKIVINVKEKEPVFIMKNSVNLYYVDALGEIIDVVSDDIFVDLPIVESNINDIKDIIKLINSNLPIAKQNIGWISSTDNYLKYYDYKHGVFWYIDKLSYTRSVQVGKKIWDDLEKRKEFNLVRSIKVIGDLAWVGF